MRENYGLILWLLEWVVKLMTENIQKTGVLWPVMWFCDYFMKIVGKQTNYFFLELIQSYQEYSSQIEFHSKSI